MTKIWIAVATLGALCSCAGIASKIKKTLDVEGTYTGNLPSASGMGMIVTITLEKDAYVKMIEYVGKDGIFENKGNYSLNKRLYDFLCGRLQNSVSLYHGKSRRSFK
jgi:hypothetical protein